VPEGSSGEGSFDAVVVVGIAGTGACVGVLVLALVVLGVVGYA